VFVHSYNSSSATNSRNGETNVKLIPYEIELMHEATTLVSESVDSFRQLVNVSDFYLYLPPKKDWFFPTSLENMLYQWNSIQQVWDQMIQHENAKHTIYQRVGLFRTDVLYQNNINISDGLAVTGNFDNFANYTNDRIFYGLRKYALLWATGRFSHVKPYLNTMFGKTCLLHSESFIFHLMQHWQVPL